MITLQEISEKHPFKDLEKNALLKIASTFRPCKFSSGTPIVVQDQIIEQIGFITTGSANLYIRDPNGNKIIFGSIKKNDFFGVMAVIADRLSMFSVICQEQTICQVQDRKDFFRFIKTYAILKDFFYHEALKRIWNSHQAIYKFRDISPKTQLPKIPRILEKSLLHIDKNYREPLTLGVVARESGMSKCHFSRIFKDRMGFSFKEYLNRKRIEAAKSLMRDQDMNVSEACFEVGFNDLSYFSRVFRKLEGVNPSRYRRVL